MSRGSAVEFFVPGRCQPGGSKRFLGVKSGKGIVVDDNPNAGAWKERVALAAHAARCAAGIEGLMEGPLCVRMTFWIARPKAHLRANGCAKASAPPSPTGKPDALKLARSCEDGMSGVVYRDDAQIVEEHLFKQYAEPIFGQVEGVKIHVSQV